jgi:DNA polymerase III delta prime subunit
MNSYLIISSSKKFTKIQIDQLRDKYKISKENLQEIIPETTFGIDEVRQLQNLLKLKPYDGGYRMTVIKNADYATLPAQNALLKLLEEPPIKNIIILVSVSAEKLLGTIQSRCQTIHEVFDKAKSTMDPETCTIIKSILNSKTGDRINLSMKYTKNREETIKFLNQITDSLEKTLFEKDQNLTISTKDTAILIDKINKAKKLIEGNVNYKAVTDILLLSFPKYNE